jgi:L-proline amide hydrolase
VYSTLNGPSEFHVIGPFEDFGITGQRGRIRLPALLFCAEFDQVTPATMGQAHEGIPGSEFVMTAGARIGHGPDGRRPRSA